jgi:hypothetical protein
MYHGTGRLFKDVGLGIKPADYTNGYTLYVFDLTPDAADSSNASLLQEGNLSLEIKLSTTLSDPTTIVAYIEYDSIIEIDQYRNVHIQT